MLDLGVGLVAAAWSRTEQLLAAATEQGNLILVSEASRAALATWSSSVPRAQWPTMQDWGIAEEVDLFAGLDRVVPQRELTQETLPPALRLAASDAHISWRGDGQYLATCARPQAGMRAACTLPVRPPARSTHGSRRA